MSGWWPAAIPRWRSCGQLEFYRRQAVFCSDCDVVTIPGNIKKTFGQVSKAVSHVHASGDFPVVLERAPAGPSG